MSNTFQSDAIDIERKLFALAIWIWVGYRHFYATNTPVSVYFDYQSSLLQWQQQQPLSLGAKLV